MLIRVCDLCNSTIEGNKYRTFSMAGPTMTIRTYDGIPAENYVYASTEVCMHCARTISSTIRGIISGGSEPPYTPEDDLKGVF